MGITRMLSDVSGLTIIGEANSGETAITQTRELNPDVVLMDVRMPGIGGLEATRKLLQYDRNIKIIAVTVCDEEPFPSRLMQAGAVGYVTKGAPLEEMISAIRKVAAGQRHISPDIAELLLARMYAPDTGGPFDSLSEREMQIALMSVGCEKVQSISEKLHLSPKTVNTYRYRIFEKLNITSDVELALLAVRHGMIDASPDQV